MADLRALLGDKYDETIEKAVEALYDECGRPLSCSKHGHMDEAVSALAAVLPDLMADAWDEGHADGLHNSHEHREHRKLRNPYRPEPITRDATCAPVTLAAPDAINPPPDPSEAVTEPHNTEGA